MSDLKPGRDLDILISKTVFKRDPCVCERPDIKGHSCYEWCGRCKKSLDYNRYSVDIAAAWEVIEKIVPPGCDDEMVALAYRAGSSDWICEFNSSGAVNAKTAPHAICLAALKLEY